MGNSCKRCFGIHRTNVKYIRSDLVHSQDLSIEFENLMTNDYYDDLNVATQKGAPFTVASYMKWLSDQEKSFMEDEEEEPKNVIAALKARQCQNNNIISQLIQENGPQSNQHFSNSLQRNWCTFGDEANLTKDSRLSDDQLTGYFLDELSRDIEITRDMVDPNKPIVYEEEEIDGPELARLIRKMRPRDLFLTGGNRDLLTTAHSSIFVGNSSLIQDRDSSHITNLYSKIHHNLMKGIKDPHSGATSERDQSSIDLDWDHEPGMNPSSALEHKRTDTEEDLINRLNSVQPNHQYSFQTLINHSHLSNTSNLISTSNYKSLVQPSCPMPQDPQSPAPSLMSPDQMYYNDELVWDLEDEMFTEDLNIDLHSKMVLNSNLEPGYSSSMSIVTSDKCHLLQD